MSASSTPTAPGGVNKRLLYGIGAGCGCLSLIVGVVAIVFIFAAIPRAPSGQPQPGPQPVAPQPQPQPVPPRPQPVAPQPQPQPVPPQPQPGGAVEGPLEGPDNFKIAGARTVKVRGEPPNVTPGEPTTTFYRGEIIGLHGVYAVVRGSHDALILWARMEGDRPILVAKGEIRVSEVNEGRPFFATLSGSQHGSPGIYKVGIIKIVGEQGQPVTIRQFLLQ